MIYDTRSRDFVVLFASGDQDEVRQFTRLWAELKTTHPLRVVSSASQSLDYLMHRGEFADVRSSPAPGLFIVSLSLPEGGGLKFLQEIKAVPGLKRLPIIILDKGVDGSNIERSYELGAASFIALPDSTADKLKRLEFLLKFWEEVSLPDLNPNYENGY